MAEQVIAPARRTMMDMFRRGGVEMALSTSVLESIERKIGGNLSDYVMNITVKQAMKTRGEDAERVIMKELSQMVDKRVWRHTHRLSALDRGRIIRSQMFLKEKYLPTGEFEKLKARLVAGGGPTGQRPVRGSVISNCEYERSAHGASDCRTREEERSRS